MSKSYQPGKISYVNINVTLSAKTSLMLEVHKAGFHREGILFHFVYPYGYFLLHAGKQPLVFLVMIGYDQTYPYPYSYPRDITQNYIKLCFIRKGLSNSLCLSVSVCLFPKMLNLCTIDYCCF